MVPIDVDAQGIRTDLLRADRSGAKCVHVTPSHQYPTWCDLTAGASTRADQLGDRAWQVDHRGRLRQRVPLRRAADCAACRAWTTINARSTSVPSAKPCIRGCGSATWCCLLSWSKPSPTHSSIMDGHTPQSLQLTLARFMEDGHYNAHVRAMRKLYAARRAAMLDAIGRHLGAIVTALSPQGGLQFPVCWPRVGRKKTPSARAARVGVQLPGLSRLYAGVEKKHGWLLGYSSLTAHRNRSRHAAPGRCAEQKIGNLFRSGSARRAIGQEARSVSMLLKHSGMCVQWLEFS